MVGSVGAADSEATSADGWVLLSSDELLFAVGSFDGLLFSGFDTGSIFLGYVIETPLYTDSLLRRAMNSEVEFNFRDLRSFAPFNWRPFTMAQDPMPTPVDDNSHKAGRNAWGAILIWAVVHFAMCILVFLFFVLFVPGVEETFSEFGIEISMSTEFTIAQSERAIRYWPVVLFNCLIYPAISVGLMYVTRKRKKLFYLMAVGMALLPLLLILAHGFTLLSPVLEILRGRGGGP